MAPAGSSAGAICPLVAWIRVAETGAVAAPGDKRDGWQLPCLLWALIPYGDRIKPCLQNGNSAGATGSPREKRVNSFCKCQSGYSGCAAASVGTFWTEVFKGLVVIGLFRVLPAAGELVEERGRGSILNIIRGKQTLHLGLVVVRDGCCCNWCNITAKFKSSNGSREKDQYSQQYNSVEFTGLIKNCTKREIR